MAVALKVQPVEAQSEGDIIRCLRAISEGQFSQVNCIAQHTLSPAVSDLAAVLQKQLIARTESVVSISVEASRTGASLAHLLQASREVDRQTQSMAAAVEEMVASVDEISRASTQATDSARQVQNSAREGVNGVKQAGVQMDSIMGAVRDTATKINGLNQESEQIGNIVLSIDQIAKKTNLLALNATIEAARAGEMGKGFAVVAGEVKSLARLTAEATKDIRTRIEHLRAEVAGIVQSMASTDKVAQEGQQTINSVGQSITAMGEQVDSVVGRIAEISAILQQQSAASSEISRGIHLSADMTRSNIEHVEHVADAMDQIQAALAEEIKQIATADFPGKVIRLAKSDHVAWTRNLMAMAAGRMTIKADELTDHHNCRLGKWYYSPAADAYRQSPAFMALEAPHAQVHEMGKKAARLFAQKDLEGSMACIDEVEKASKEVVAKLEALAAHSAS